MVSIPGTYVNLHAREYYVCRRLAYLLEILQLDMLLTHICVTRAWNELNFSNYSDVFDTHKTKSVWYKTKFGSQILATNFGVYFMIYVMFSKICLMLF